MNSCDIHAVADQLRFFARRAQAILTPDEQAQVSRTINTIKDAGDRQQEREHARRCDPETL